MKRTTGMKRRIVMKGTVALTHLQRVMAMNNQPVSPPQYLLVLL